MADNTTTPITLSEATANRLATTLKIARPKKYFDKATAYGLVLTLALIGIALFLTGNFTSFYDLPSVLMVVLGTFTITAISFSVKKRSTYF
jgi:chemotaxis protein MotA